MENLLEKTKENNCILLTTEKDYFRISEDNKKNINYLKVSVDIENKNQFIEIIKKII
jgi:tetraacyldisaccharide-1-P 4'-kinase